MDFKRKCYDEDGYNVRQMINNDEGGLGMDKYRYWRPTFEPIIYASFGILNQFRMWKEIPYVTDCPEIVDILKQIAYINLKKTAGGSTSDMNEIHRAYQESKDIILRQIEVYNPDIIIGGNTLQFLYEDLNISVNDVKQFPLEGFRLTYHESADRILINSYHPAFLSRMGEENKGNYINAIIGLVKNWTELNS